MGWQHRFRAVPCVLHSDRALSPNIRRRKISGSRFRWPYHWPIPLSRSRPSSTGSTMGDASDRISLPHPIRGLFQRHRRAMLGPWQRLQTLRPSVIDHFSNFHTSTRLHDVAQHSWLSTSTMKVEDGLAVCSRSLARPSLCISSQRTSCSCFEVRQK